MFAIKLSSSIAVVCWTTFAIAGPHYTVRLHDTRSGSPPKVKAVSLSPNSKLAAALTTRGIHLVGTDDGELVWKSSVGGFSMAFSKDSSKLLVIGRSGPKLLDTRSGSESSVEMAVDTGYVGLAFEHRNGKLLVERLDSRGPADVLGKINVGDELVAVGRGKAGPLKSVIRASLNDVYEMLDGPAGTYVRLSVIPKGQIDDTTYTLRRHPREQENGRLIYQHLPETNIDDRLVWCLSGGYHVLVDAATGEVISIFQMEHIVNDTGQHALSPDSTKFARVGQYLEPPKDPPSQSPKEDESLSKQQGGNITANQATRAELDPGVVDRYFGVEIHDLQAQRLESIFPVETEKESFFFGTPRAFYGVSFTPDSSEIVLATRTKLHVYDVVEKAKVRELSAPNDLSTFDLARGLAAVGGYKGKVWLLDLSTGDVVHEVRNRETQTVTNMAFSLDGHWLSYAVGGVLHLVDVSDVHTDSPGLNSQ